MTQTETYVQADGRQAYSSATVTKNTKGYSWEAKIYVPAGEEDTLVPKLRELEQKLRDEFGESE